MSSNDPSHQLRLRKSGKNTPFGTKTTLCLGVFLLIYTTFMITFVPSLEDESRALKTKEQFTNAKNKILKNKRALVGKVIRENNVWNQELKMIRDKNDEQVKVNLIEKAMEQFQNTPRLSMNRKKTKADSILKKKDNVLNQPRLQVEQIDIMKDTSMNTSNSRKTYTNGFIVLGMHRSGTSMLSGLLVEGFGYKTGGPLIQPAFDNEKGFFELIPVVLQNDAFMYEQNVNWAANVGRYDTDRALKALEMKQISFERGEKALKILNDPGFVPWLQKDPRMCITLRTWLPLLNSKPAVIFTYRHPLEVAMSLKKRESGFTMARGLRLWMRYNQAAVQNSHDLCVVHSSNNAVLRNPLSETIRISNELTTKCGVPQAPKLITQHVVDGFVDPKLQHNKNKLEESAEKKVLKVFNDDCEVEEFESSAVGIEREKEESLYLQAMKIYCDLENFDAYDADYEWPKI